MGGELVATSEAQNSISILISAIKDPKGANLDRVQIVKGWIDEQSQLHERVYDVAWSGDRETNDNGKLPPVTNTVDLKSGRYENSVGHESFTVKWIDPDFNVSQKSFYYARVLEIPTPRNTLFDSIALQLDGPPRGAKIIQERAYSSPLWYHPK